MDETIAEVEFDKECPDEKEQYIECDKTLLCDKEEIAETLNPPKTESNIDRNVEELDKFLENITIKIRSSLPNQCDNLDHFSCGICQGLMIDPVTLSCGHTFMKSCIVLDDESARWNCPKCKKAYNNSYISRLKPNVAITALFEKVWNKEVASMKIYHDGNQLLLANKSMLAVEKFNQALELDPLNHLAASSRSNALLSAGKTVAALKDAEKVVALHPMWALGYFYKAVALVSLKCYEEAAINFLLCYILDINSLTDAKNEAKKLLGKMIFSNSVTSLPHSIQDQASFHDFNFNTLAHVKSPTGSQEILDNDTSEGVYCPAENETEEPMDFTNCPQPCVVLNHQDQFHKLLFQVIETIKHASSVKSTVQRCIEVGPVDCTDFDCPICRRLLFQPVTTGCGHTFCRTCLDRCFDHNPLCPLCKTTLENFLSERRSVTKLIDYAIQTLLPDEYENRKKVYWDEMDELLNAGKDAEHVIPLFVCTVAYPTMPCPLHIFEPRYRLMIRQCVESGINQFGMCTYVNNQNNTTTSIATVGTMLDIRNVKYFTDGRSIVNTSGSRRFRVLQYGMRDGYYTGAVEFFHDQIPENTEIEDLQRLHDQTRGNAVLWFINLPMETQERILSHFGSMPLVEDNYWTCPDGPSWLWWMLAVLPIEASIQLKMLAVTSLSRRLEILDKILVHIQNNSPGGL